MKLFNNSSRQGNRLAMTAIGVIFLSACASTPVYEETINSQFRKHQISLSAPLSADDKADLVEAIVSADVAYQQQDYVSATSYYLFAAELTKSQELIDQAIQSAKLSGDDLGLQQAASLWLANEPDNTEARVTLISAQLKGQALEDALLQTEILLKQKESEEQAYRWVTRIILSSQGRISLAYLQQLRSHYPKSAAIALSQAKLMTEWAAQTSKPQQTLLQAFVQVENALKLKPEMESAVELKTQLLFRLRRDEEAEAYLRDRYQRNPNSAKTVELLGHLLYDLKKFKLAISHYKPWLQNHPKDLDARYYLAASYYAMRDYDNSLNQFRQLLDKEFEANTVSFYCGDSALRLNQLAQADACFRLVHEGRFYYSAQIELARIAAADGRFDDGLQILNKAQQVADKDESTEKLEDFKIRLVLEQINLLKKSQGQSAAEARLEQALQATPDNLALLFRKISLKGLEKKPQQLIALLNQARQLIKDPKKSERFERAAAALIFNNGHHQQAIDWIDQALSKTPDDQELLYSKAIYLEPLGRFEEMIKTFKHLLELSPGNINVMNALGYTLVDLNQDLDYADNLINKAYAAAPNNPAIIDSKGWLAYRKGDLKNAVKFLQASFKLKPSAEVGAHLGEVFWKMGETSKARTVWQRAHSLDKDNFLLVKTLDRFGIKLSATE